MIRILLAAALLCFTTLLSLAQDDSERSSVIRFVEDQLSTPDRMIRLNGLRGALSSEVALDSITIADRQGIWLTIDAPQLVWNRTALLSGRLDIERLVAQSITVARPPNSASDAPNMAANEFSIPQLPIGIRIGALEIDAIDLREPVLGFAARLSLVGNTTLNDDGFSAQLNVERLDDVPGSLALDVSYTREDETVSIDTQLLEPAGGIIANALQISGTPSINLSIAGTGKINALRVDIDLNADDRPVLSGAVTTTPTRRGTQLAVDIGGPLARIVPADIAVLLGPDNTLRANALFADSGELIIDQLTLDGGVVNLTGNLNRDAQGAYTRAQLDIGLTPKDGQSTIALPGALPVTLGKVAIDLDFDNNANPPLQVAVDADHYKSPTLSFQQVDFDLEGTLIEATKGLDFTGSGQVAGIETADDNLNAALGTRLDVNIDGAWHTEEPFRIDVLRLAARDIAASLSGQMDGTRLEATGTLTANALSALAKMGGVDMRGTANLAFDGNFDVLTRAFDLTLNGDANTAFEQATMLDNVLSGPVSLNGRLSRTTRGTRVERFALSGRAIDMTANGLLSPVGTDLTLNANLADLALLTPDAQGRTALNARLTGRAPRYGISANLTVPEGRLSRLNAEQLSVRFDGAIEGQSLQGNLGADGTLGGNAIALSGMLTAASDRMRLADLRFALGPNTITGALERNGSALLNGALTIDAPDIAPLAALALQDMSGRASAQVALTPIGNSQQITITADAGNLALNGVSINNAVTNLTVSDALRAPRFAGTLGATGVALNALSIDAVEATLGGALQATNFTITANQVQLSAAPQLAPATITASGAFDATNSLLSLRQFTIANRQEISISGDGTLALANNTLNLQVNGQAPLGAAEPFLTGRGTTIAGLARFDATVTGNTSNPQINGLLSVADGTLSDPLSNIRLTGINLLAGLNGNQVSVNRMNARIGDTGQLNIAGTVSIAATMPADLQLRLTRIPYSDGQTFATTLDGDLALTGPLAGQPTVSGTINLARTEIVVPETFGAAANLIEVQHVEPDRQTSHTLRKIAQLTPANGATGGGGVNLDVTINAPAQIFVRGSGLDAELGGTLRVRGNSADVSPVGQFNLRRGRLQILSQRLDFDTGTIRLIGDLDPFLNFRATSQVGDTTAFVTISGRPSELQFAFTSSPQLPQDEVVALLLFGRPVSELSPVQILRLASAVSELTGQDALNLVGLSRDILGIDDLDIVDDGEGNAAVRAGTYINERVYLSVEAGSETEASINLDITDNLKARGSVASDGESKLGVFFERDY